MKTLPASSPARKGFSLVELLVVLAIIAVLSGLTVSSIAGQGGSRAVANAGNLLENLASQARQRAITHHTMTALVLVNASGSADWDYRLLRVMRFVPGAKGWEAASKWHSLPKGALIDPSQSGSFLAFSRNISLPTAIGPILCQGALILPSSYSFVVFLPDGRLLTTIDATNPNPAPPSLRIVQGRMSGGSVVYAGSHASGQPRNYYDLTFNVFTGIAKADLP